MDKNNDPRFVDQITNHWNSSRGSHEHLSSESRQKIKYSSAALKIEVIWNGYNTNIIDMDAEIIIWKNESTDLLQL